MDAASLLSMDSRSTPPPPPPIGRADADEPSSAVCQSSVSQISRPAFFDLLFLSTPSSPVGSSLPLTEANMFADALGVAPIYRQKESKRWSSALQLYRQMSNHDIAERGLNTTTNTVAAAGGSAEASFNSSMTTSSGLPAAAAGSQQPDSDAAAAGGGGGRLDVLFDTVMMSSSSSCSRSQTPNNVVSRDESATNLMMLPRNSSSNARGLSGNPTPSYYSSPGANRDRSRDTSGDHSPGESSLNSLELEAIAAVHELHFAVRDISVSDLLPRTSELIFLNVTTLEGQAYCVELTAKGWRVTSLRHDCMNGDIAHLNLHTIYFETIYSLMDTISVCYRQRFTDLLALRLRQLQALSASSSHLVQVPEIPPHHHQQPTSNKSALDSASSAVVDPSAATSNSGNIVMLVSEEDGMPITINVRRSSAADLGTAIVLQPGKSTLAKIAP